MGVEEGSGTRVLRPQLRIRPDRRTITIPKCTSEKSLHQSVANFHRQTTPRSQTIGLKLISSQFRDLPSDPGGRRARSRSGQQPLPGTILAHWDKALMFHSAWVKEHLHLGPQFAILTVTPIWLPPAWIFLNLYILLILLLKKSH